MSKYALFPIGDKGIVINFGQTIDKKTHQKVKQAFYCLQKHKNNSILDIVPTYNTITIYFNWKTSSYKETKQWINACLATNDRLNKVVNRKTFMEIPVYYGDKFGPDIERVAKHNQISVKEVIKKHSSCEYLIYMMGFLPGFPYLGGLPDDLATPRLHSPRAIVEAGSVGIAGNQTGIYSISSPGGWNIIGQTPIEIFQPKKKNSFLLEIGNFIKFKPITIEEFLEIKNSN